MSKRTRQRGAAVIEYAFLIVLAVVPLSSLVGNLQDAEKDRLTTSSQRVGMPEEFASNVPPSGNATPASGTDTSTTSIAEASITMSGTSSSQGSKKWTATIGVEIVDANGDPILDAEITGTWQRVYVDGTVTTEVAHCSADSSGECTLSLWNLRTSPHVSAVDQVIFIVTGLVATDTSPASGVIGSTVAVPHA